MLSKEDNDLITQTDRAHLWVSCSVDFGFRHPSEELPGADCNPVRVKIMGEDLVAFRDSKGKPGLIDAYCPHRGAPMFFARNEEEGIRCLYHGWKFNTAGDCVDMPNIAHGETAKNRMHTIAYPTVESANMIWAYMGPEDRKPPFPEFPYTTEVPKGQVYVTRYEINCNWLQAQEGDYDPTHAMFVHSTLGANRDVAGEIFGPGRIGSVKPGAALPRNTGFANTSVGLMFTSAMPLDDEKIAVRSSHFILPCFSPAGIANPGLFSANIRVPIDDEHENHFRLRWARREFTEQELFEFKHGGYTFPLQEAGTYLSQQRKDNDYGFDPVLQRQFNYSGVVPFPTQDLMMIEHQWGAIAKRDREHLVASDRDIITMRRRLLRMAKALAEGIEPTEPFEMRGLRQSPPERTPVVMSRRAQLSEEDVATFLEQLNANAAAPDSNEEQEEIWAPSAEAAASEATAAHEPLG